MEDDAKITQSAGDKAGAHSLWKVVTGLTAKTIGHTLGAQDQPPTASDVLAISLRHAVKLFIDTTAGAGQEEHKTSAFMGYVGACLNLYNLVSALSGGCQASLQWNAQTKKQESRTGGDLGIAFPASEGRYKLAFFQAKELGKGASEDRVKASIDVNRISSAYKQPPALAGGEDGEALRKGADEELIDWVLGRSVKQVGHLTSVAVKGKSPSDEPKLMDFSHQLTRLGRMQHAHPEGEWLYYLGWGTEAGQEPVAVALEEIRVYLNKKNLGTTSFSKSGMGAEMAHIPLTDQARDGACAYGRLFDIVVDEARSFDTSDWLLLDTDTAVDLIGTFIAIGQEWYVADDGRAGGLAERLQANTLRVVTGGQKEIPLQHAAIARRLDGVGPAMLTGIDLSADALALVLNPATGSKHAM